MRKEGTKLYQHRAIIGGFAIRLIATVYHNLSNTEVNEHQGSFCGGARPGVTRYTDTGVYIEGRGGQDGTVHTMKVTALLLCALGLTYANP
ncbi:hypothetical protein J6590_103234, partial [Homalodisca vitripennis]